jgi:hypothetical protein
MAIAHARTLVVGGATYQWKIQAPKNRYNLDCTPGRLTLIIQGQGEHRKQRGIFACRSKLWTAEFQQAWDDFDSSCLVPEHKVPFGPGQVREVIDAGLTDCVLDDWVVTRA